MKKYAKIVYIVGPGYRDEHDVWLHRQKGILPSHNNITIIGNGYDSIPKKDFESLKGNIDVNTAFHIMAHGGWDDKTGSHLILLHKDKVYRTEKFLKELQSLNEDIPMNIFLWSCFSGKALQAVNSLVVGSTLVIQANTEMPVNLALKNAAQIMASSFLHENNQSKHPIIDVIRHATSLIVGKLTIVLKTLLGFEYHDVLPKIDSIYEDNIIELNKQVQRLVDFVQKSSLAKYYDTSYISAPYNISLSSIEDFFDNQFIWQINEGDIEKIEILLTLDTDSYINKVDEYGRGFLFIASQRCQDKLVNFILERGAVIDGAANDGMTSLIIAVQNSCEKVVQSLLAHGANPNLARNDGCTPLTMSAQKGNEKIVKLLLNYGSDPTLQTTSKTLFGKDWYAHERAYACKHYEVAKLLEYAKSKYLAKCYGDDDQEGISLLGNHLEGIEYI